MVVIVIAVIAPIARVVIPTVSFGMNVTDAKCAKIALNVVIAIMRTR